MNKAKSTINKQTGTKMCVDYLHAGKKRSEIIQLFAETYKDCPLSDSTIDKWIKAARPLVAERLAADEEAIRIQSAAAVGEVAKRLSISKEAVLEGYAKIGFFDIRTVFDEAGNLKPIAEIGEIAGGAIAGIEIEERHEKSPGKDDAGEKIPGALTRVYKIKLSDKRSALDSICKVMGYLAPIKVADTKADGTDKPKTRQVFRLPDGKGGFQEVEFE